MHSAGIFLSSPGITTGFFSSEDFFYHLQEFSVHLQQAVRAFYPSWCFPFTGERSDFSPHQPVDEIFSILPLFFRGKFLVYYWEKYPLVNSSYFRLLYYDFHRIFPVIARRLQSQKIYNLLRSIVFSH